MSIDTLFKLTQQQAKIDDFLASNNSYLSCLINNAGVGKGFAPIFQAEPEDINTTTETNITSFLHLLRAVVPGMVERKKGHIKY